MQFEAITVRHAYVARCADCRGILHGIADNYEYRHVVALRLADWVLGGHAVERMRVADAAREWEATGGCCCAEADNILRKAGLP